MSPETAKNTQSVMYDTVVYVAARTWAVLNVTALLNSTIKVSVVPSVVSDPVIPFSSELDST